jgi:indolepyruvate ferredoxin oxidoreductase beta subunit
MTSPAPDDGGPIGVLFAGVGGQGVLLIAEALALAAVAAGYDAKQTEVHGVSQRGGSVHSHVRFGPKVHSPLIPKGDAHVVAGLEKLETLRFAPFARPGAVVVMNDLEIPPISAGASGVAAYPHDAAERLERAGLKVALLPATEHAARLGNEKAANMIVLGYVAALLPIPRSTWRDLLVTRTPARHRAVNEQAFALGFDWGLATGRIVAPASPPEKEKVT